MSDKGAIDTFGIGTKLRTARRSQGLSLRQLASKAEVSASLLSQIENGKANPSVRSLHSIGDALSLSVDYFFPTKELEEEEGQPGKATRTNMTASELRASRSDPLDVLVDDESGEPADSTGPLLRAADRLTIELQGDVTWTRLTAEPEEKLEFLEVCYEVGASSGEKMSHHTGREFGLILEGELLLELGFERYRLEAGDSIVFESVTPHRLTNAGEVPLKAVWVVMDTA
jgi:transcriptional regulator with XRE-family HTH domain